MFNLLLRSALILLFLLATTLAATNPSHALSIDWVNVGVPGNAADSTGHGAVDHTFALGVNEISNFQYAQFLNAVASVSDPDSELTARYREIARNTAAQLSKRPRNLALNLPQINIVNT